MKIISFIFLIHHLQLLNLKFLHIFFTTHSNAIDLNIYKKIIFFSKITKHNSQLFLKINIFLSFIVVDIYFLILIKIFTQINLQD